MVVFCFDNSSDQIWKKVIEKIVCKFEAEGRKLATLFKWLEHFFETGYFQIVTGGFYRVNMYIVYWNSLNANCAEYSKVKIRLADMRIFHM